MRVEPQVLSPIKKHEKRHKKTLKTLGFSRVKVAQEEGYAARGEKCANRSAKYWLMLTSPRDADTAITLCLEVRYVPAVCELPVSLRELEFVPSDCGNKNRSTREE